MNPASVYVWDPLVRLMHWSLASAVILALVSDENHSASRMLTTNQPSVTIATHDANTKCTK